MPSSGFPGPAAKFPEKRPAALNVLEQNALGFAAFSLGTALSRTG